MRAEYEIPEDNLSALRAQLEKLNKRAAKLGVEPVKIETAIGKMLYRVSCMGGGFTPWGEKKPEGGTIYTLQLFTVTVEGVAPKFNGWTLAATLEPVATEDGANLNLLQCIPGMTIPNEYRDKVGTCDHCKTNRRRSQTFVVKHDDGTFKNIGRNCIRDFLGHACPHEIAQWAELLSAFESACSGAEDYDDEGGGSRRERDRVETDSFLAYACGVISQLGFVSRGVAKESCGKREATADTIAYLLFPPPRMQDKEKREYDALKERCEPTEEHRIEAEKAREWARSLPEAVTEKNNYLANVNAVARVHSVTGKLFGIAASIISAHSRAIGDELKRKAELESKSNEFCGTIKKREVFSLTVEKVIPLESNFGTSFLHKMRDEKGNAFVWFSTAGKLDENKSYKLKATVKAHEVYNGRNQTTLSRAAVQE